MDKTQKDPWFEDGNLILEADDNICFKVHRGVLARQSEIFQDMLAIPQPEVQAMDPFSCQTVRMHDLPAELALLLKAIYDGTIFENRDIDDFFYLASILRLSTKYFISNLRLQAIKALLRTWSNTLQGHDAMVERALQAPTNSDPDSLTYPYVHPIHVLNLARETNVQIIIPSALYFLSIYPIKDIISGTHPKLTVKSRLGLPRPSSILSHEDMKNYSIMYQHRIDLILDYSRNVLGKRRASSSCVFANAKSNSEDLDGYASRCTQAFARLASLVSRSWYTRTGPLKWMLQSIEMIDKNELPLCHICRYHFTNDVQARRKWIWKTLPGIIDLPSWEEMEKMDLSEDLSNSTLD